ncbi:hypothetical protein ONE63_000358 [Megalurothrips usitatus]|uniref:Uncharacterized protein n=1 Tax=Megalurothrips usitatus TaxID=439358 RepID=A0AAV7Y495_9NEOP|nr:hypothetical protein ONE63_000358 [Megalurothrips usitatus]
MARTSSSLPLPKYLPAFAAFGPTSCASPMYRPQSRGGLLVRREQPPRSRGRCSREMKPT